MYFNSVQTVLLQYNYNRKLSTRSLTNRFVMSQQAISYPFAASARLRCSLQIIMIAGKQAPAHQAHAHEVLWYIKRNALNPICRSLSLLVDTLLVNYVTPS